MKLATLLLFLAASAFGAADQLHSAYIYNGRSWRDHNYTEKLAYLTGMQDGFNAAGGKSCVKATNMDSCTKAAQQIKDSVFGNLNFAEAIEGVDDFYRDPASVLIPVPEAMECFQLKLNGETPEQLSKYVAVLRRVYSQAK
jgi:hypothetical protein